MIREISYKEARANLAGLCERVVETREVFIIRRRGARDVALVAVDELESLLETAHLLRSPKNARRLSTAMRRARAQKLKGVTLDQVRRELRIGGLV